MAFRCYVCGKPIADEFAIVSPTTLDTDRGFTLHLGDCLEQASDEAGLIVECVAKHKEQIRER